MNAITFIKAVPKIIAGAWRAYRWIRKQDQNGVAFLSPLFFAEARKAIETFTLALTKGQDEGIRALFESDNALLCGMGILMKSDAILAVYRADKALARQMAEVDLRNKDTSKSVEKFNGAVYPVH